MAGIAGIVRWDDRAVATATITAMLDVVRHRGPDGLHAEARGSAGFGHARLALNARERDSTQPLATPDGRYWLVADAWLSNRRELRDALAATAWLGDAPLDAEILLAAYERWGADAVQHLRGDFAFAVWDEAARTLHAARDPFGLKPFFYATSAQRLAFGSEPKQLLVLPDVRSTVNEGKLIDLLATDRDRASEETYHVDVVRLRAAHALSASADGVRVTRWWNPCAEAGDTAPLPDDEYPRRYYHLLRRAVERALDVEAPAAIELSGGYDSSSIVVTAAEVHAERPASLPPVHTLSHRYPGLPCDEGEMIEAVLAVSPFPAIQVEVVVADPTPAIDAELRKCDAPRVEICWARRRAEVERLAAVGCRVVLTGLGGDELSWDPDFAPDLWRSGRYFEALRYCLSDSRVRRDRARRETLHRLARFVVPAIVKRIVRRFRPITVALPPWLAPRAAGEVRRREDARRAGTIASPFAQDVVRGWLDKPELHLALETVECLAAWGGFERRHPFLDRDLVEFVLAIPWQARYRQPGAFKTLLVRALGSRLPERIRTRNGKTIFDTYFVALYDAGAPSLRERLGDGAPWASGELIEREALLAAIDARRAATDADTLFATVSQPWTAALVELWLRAAHPRPGVPGLAEDGERHRSPRLRARASARM